jgi:putative membrane protein
MKRLTLPLLAAGMLALNSCSSADKSTTDTASTGTSTSTTDASATAAAPATVDTANSATTTASASGAAGTTAGGMADANGPTAPHATDAEFMQSAAHSDQNEIQLSKMALTKGVSATAKSYANQMITDHTKSSAMLKPIAAKAGVTLPTDMDAEHKALAPTMAKLTGKEFETKFLAQMVTDHQKTANTLKAHQTMTKDTQLQGWITTTLPVVEGHLSMANKDSNMKM